MGYIQGQVVDITHNVAGEPVTVTVTIVSYDESSKQLFVAPIRRAGLMLISTDNILTCIENTSTGYEYAFPIQNTQQIAKKYEQNLATRKELSTQFQSSSSEYGKYIFTMLAKNANCQWDGVDIIIGDTIRISAPYEPENCTTISSNSSQVPLLRMKKVIERLKSDYRSKNEA